MKSKATEYSVLTVAFLLLLGVVRSSAQMPGPPPPPEPGHDMFYVRTFRLEDNKVVTGSPYSADAVTENTQVLADGNRIVRKETAKVYRDGMGRTRRDLSVNAIGPWSSGAPMQMANIFDPVARVQYMLNMQEKKAFTMPSPRKPPADGPGLMTKDRVFFAGRGVTPAAPAMAMVEKDAGIGNRVETSLGTQEIEGVQAQGTRTTETIPAGKIGNEKPIIITTERWYSPDLQVDVLVKHSDPRMGEVVYQLTNISREEPDSSLFQVPADYTVQEGPMVFQKRLH